jgi:DNA-binding MarR family transcriptional regulator
VIGGDTPPEALGDYTGFLLNWVGQRSRARFGAALGSVGLHPREFATMTILDRAAGMTQQELSRSAAVDTSTMVALLDSLEKAGLAERRPHPADRRKHAVHLTAKGKRTLARARALAAKVGEETFGALSADERRQFHALLRKLAGLG